MGVLSIDQQTFDTILEIDYQMDWRTSLWSTN